MAESVSIDAPRAGRPSGTLETWAIVALGVVLVGLAAAFLIRTSSIGADGSSIVLSFDSWTAEGIGIETVDSNSDGPLLPGDRIAAINGASHETIGAGLLEMPPASGPWSVGDTVTYTVLRDGDVVEVDVTLGRYPLWGVLRGSVRTQGSTLFVASIAALKTHTAEVKASAASGESTTVWNRRPEF